MSIILKGDLLIATVDPENSNVNLCVLRESNGPTRNQCPAKLSFWEENKLKSFEGNKNLEFFSPKIYIVQA